MHLPQSPLWTHFLSFLLVLPKQLPQLRGHCEPPSSAPSISSSFPLCLWVPPPEQGIWLGSSTVSRHTFNGCKYMEPGRRRSCATVQGHVRSRFWVRITSFQNCHRGPDNSDEYLRNRCHFGRCWDFKDFYVFSCNIFGFGFRVMLVLKKWIGKYFLLFNFLEEFV